LRNKPITFGKIIFEERRVLDRVKLTAIL